jgi:hypothetical protein
MPDVPSHKILRIQNTWTLSVQPQKILRIQSTSEEKGAQWIERYFLANKRGHFRELKKIPGNHQYPPGTTEILAWFESLGVTHVYIVKGWWNDVFGLYTLRQFAKLMRRISRDAVDVVF